MSQGCTLAALEKIGPATARSVSDFSGLSYAAVGANIRRLLTWDLVRRYGISAKSKKAGAPAIVWIVAGPIEPRAPPRRLTFGFWRRADRTGPVIGRTGRPIALLDCCEAVEPLGEEGSEAGPLSKMGLVPSPNMI
jgi:hypothetical protein